MINKLFNRFFSTLQGRLTFWYLISVGSIIISLLVAASILFWNTLQEQIDHHIHITVNEAIQIFQDYPHSERNNRLQSLVSAQGMTVVVLSPDGTPIIETNSPDIARATENELQTILKKTDQNDHNPTHFTQGNIRFAAISLSVNDGQGIIAVGYSTQVLYNTFYHLFSITIILLVFPITPTIYFGYHFLQKQLSPLQKIARDAQSVTDSSSLTKRVHLHSSATKELFQIQEALNTMLARLELIFKNEREFFSDAAHTLKTPLAVLLSQIESSSLSQKTKDQMSHTVTLATDTIQDLLFLSRITSQPPQLEPVSLTDILTDLTELAATLGEDKSLTVTSNLQPDITLNADKDLLQRALSNIVHNAVLYNKPFGQIIVTLIRNKTKTTITIQDSGIGISKKDQSHIFSRFFRGSNSGRNGSGLGLAISKTAIESLGGKISFVSQPNIGSTATIVFPTQV